MRCLGVLGALVFTLSLGAIPAAAQGQGNIPPGDYAQTCRHIRTDGNRLEAECQKTDGHWRKTSLDNVDQCGSVINNDGHLQCGGGNGSADRDRDRDWDRDRDRDRDRGNRSGWQGNLPPGDYVQTCRNVSVDGDRLNAECQTRDGNWRRTSLDDIDRCGAIVNDNGHLMCGR